MELFDDKIINLLKPNIKISISINCRRLSIKQGIVSSRVTLLLRSAEIQPIPVFIDHKNGIVTLYWHIP